MRKENVMVKTNGVWQDVYNYINTLNLNIIDDNVGIDFVKKTYPIFKNFNFEVDGIYMNVILPADFVMQPMNGYGIA